MIMISVASAKRVKINIENTILISIKIQMHPPTGYTGY
jgi:hypothetical protein